MVIPNMPPCPPSLKAIQHYLTIATEHDGRDLIVAYWCRLYALQQGLKIDKSSAESKKLLFFLMDWLEAEKAKEKDNEAIAHEVAAQAHLENYALKLFLRADEQDRAGVFNKNVIKGFYTAGMLYAMLEMFGELTEEVSKNQKYAKWKAAYIHNCLKAGETPIPGPAGGDPDQNAQSHIGFTAPGPSAAGGFQPPNSDFNNATSNIPGPGYPPTHSESEPAAFGGPAYPPTMPSPGYPPGPDVFGRGGQPPPTTPATPARVPYNIPPDPVVEPVEPSAAGGVSLTPEMITKAQKLCKYASSALNYDDINTAVSNLREALTLLTGVKQ